ncbi:cytochrome P450 [Neophaeococcomyces mojaviensis]|uniref:Cytochrome P450 n=1 Tax=Neophaeococcomyces mojaviensis TaxID=3383035 RepID=A0ACC3A0J7_9EURO|nr:cytochrome P450 [Knufia sp. JES_112]
MASTVLLGLLVLAIYYVGSRIIALRKNIARAKASGIHYVIVPIYWLNRFWLITHPFWLKILRRLPPSWTAWVDFTIPLSTFAYRYEIFERVGHDTFLTVAPGGLFMFTCEPAVISQITTRRNDFPKPIEQYQAVDVYGKNVVSTEGATWRMHRKATSPPFTEKNNVLVWEESIRQAEAMLRSWVGPEGKGGRTTDRIMDDTMRLSLNVISAAGFGRKMEWPSEESAKEDVVDKSGYVDVSKIRNEEDDIDPGHSMSYTYAIHCLLDNILLQFIFPKSIMRWIPSATIRKAEESYMEWGNYMREMLLNKKEALETGNANKETNDILTQLVKGQLVDPDAKTKQQLTQEELLGNMFVLILAGHETAANSIHFSVLYMALHADSQRRLQKDLDKTLQGRSPTEWDYDQDLPALFGGMAGAVLAEELRLLPPVPNIPKSTIGVSEQKLVVEGRDCIAPKDMQCVVACAVAHRHPGFWPKGPPRLPGGNTAHPLSNVDNDLEEFRPERWILTETANGVLADKDGIPVESLGGGDLGVNESSDTSELLFKPAKGSYLPFSEGYRACLGRRFAQVEVLAVLAVLFQNYSVELAVDKYATDEELDTMDINQKAEVWHQAAEDARHLMLTGMGQIITLQIRNGTVPFRFVPRGQERFPEDVDEIWKRNHPNQVSDKGMPGWSCWRNASTRIGAVLPPK